MIPAALALGLALHGGPAHAETPPAAAGLWLGHTRVGSERHLPILGTLRTRTDTWVLARLSEEDGRLVVEQEPCAMEIKPVAGVRVGMTPAAVRTLPRARFELLPADAEAFQARPWTTAWGEDDLDADEEPGVSIHVRSPLCGGRLSVASRTRSEALARWEDGGLVGEIAVEVEQRILDATGACLRAVAQDSRDEVRGHFRYTPAPPGASCDALPRSAWPVAPEGP